MADPRSNPVQNRRNPLSPLMKAKMDALRAGGDVVNFCKFGCQDSDLDEHGYCHHLVGFIQPPHEMYEPRIRVKDKGQSEDKIITTGAKKLHMQSKYVLVRITSTYRVYSPTPAKHLMKRSSVAETDPATARENELISALESLRDRDLEGEWGEGLYANLLPVGVTTVVTPTA